MKTYKNITRYTYEFTSFQGWRLSLCRNGRVFTHYFSDRQYGSEEASLEAALQARTRLWDCLHEHPYDPEVAIEICKQELMQAPPYEEARKTRFERLAG